MLPMRAAVPYSEAVNPEIQQPALDGQLAVYDAVQSLLSDAIANLQTGQGAPIGGVDLNFNGTTSSWVAVGPARMRVRSKTRRPVSGAVM